MDWKKELFPENEKPLDRLVDGYSNTSIFRKIAFIGDSLSSGEFETRDKDGNAGYHDLFEYSWGQYIARKNGLFAYNFSRGGMTAREYVETFADKMGYWDEDKKAQAYVIALGVNDIFNLDHEVGTKDDVDKENYKNNKQTFMGYYATIISKYKEISPDAKFFLVTFPNTKKPHLEEKTHKMIKALYELADIFENTYVINLYEYGPEYDDEFRKKYFLYGHMNPMGYIFTARIVDSYIDYIIRHNPEDFKFSGLVNSGIQYKF